MTKAGSVVISSHSIAMISTILTNRISVNIIAYVLLLGIAVVDYVTGYEASSSILYFFPIYVAASNRKTYKTDALIVAACSSFAWLAIEILTHHPYSSIWILYWNTFVRAVMFFAVAILFYKVKAEKIQIEENNEQLKTLNAEKNKYLGIAAHDIRNPLGNIYNLSILLLDPVSRGNMTQQQVEFIEMIHKVSRNGLMLLNNILDITQIEAGTLRLSKTENDYIQFVKDIISSNKYIAERKEQTILFESQAEALPLFFDASYMSQVVTNLLTNAIKYSYPKKDIKVSIKKNEHAITTEVTDQGVGIKAEDREKVFRPFEKAQNRPTSGEESSGLGLAIVKKIVEAHQGKIGFESIYGQGSTFYFTLPLVAQPATQAPQPV